MVFQGENLDHGGMFHQIIIPGGPLRKNWKQNAEQWCNVQEETMPSLYLDAAWWSVCHTTEGSAATFCTYLLSLNNGTKTWPLPSSSALHPSFTLSQPFALLHSHLFLLLLLSDCWRSCHLPGPELALQHFNSIGFLTTIWCIIMLF